MSKSSLSLLGLLLAVTLSGCDGCGNEGGGPGGPIDAGPASARDVGPATRVDAGLMGGVDAGPGAQGVDGGVAPTSALRFVVLGDTGEGNEAQREVAVQIRDLCAREGGCAFGLLLGDNFYNSGVASVEDPQWRTKFEEPYRDLPFTFYAVLGNHDYGGTILGLEQGGLGNEFGKGPIEVEYSSRSERWEMPGTHYVVRFGDVAIIGIDTNSILWNDTRNGNQRTWYPAALREVADARWILLAGHHPYRSNGRHGNAGSYESIEVAGVDVPNPVPILNGGNVRDFFEDVVCGTVDVYFAGHDHNRQWIDEPDALCGAHLVVSGAGAKTTDFEGSDNRTLFQDDTEEGFLYVSIAGDAMTARFVDRTGRVGFEHVVAPTRRR